jgi:hypothetical protein
MPVLTLNLSTLNLNSIIPAAVPLSDLSMLNLESIRQHLGVSNFTDLTNPSSLVALGLSLSLGYTAVKYLTKGPRIQPTNMAPTDPQTVVIVGGGYAGTGLAHRLLTNLAPKVPGLKVIFISKSTHLFWNFAAVRGIIPGEIADDQLFLPLAPGFAKYSDKQFEFIVGSATSLDVTGNVVEVQTANGPRMVNYDHLVLATGSKLAAEHIPFKSLNSHDETMSAWHQLQQEVDQAKSIVIAGASRQPASWAPSTATARRSSSSSTVLSHFPPCCRQLASSPRMRSGIWASKSSSTPALTAWRMQQRAVRG